LDPAKQFFLLAFGVTKIVVRELRPLLFQFALGDVPVAFNFECSHIIFVALFAANVRKMFCWPQPRASPAKLAHAMG
jgi:hypothetical protein